MASSLEHFTHVLSVSIYNCFYVSTVSGNDFELSVTISTEHELFIIVL